MDIVGSKASISAKPTDSSSLDLAKGLMVFWPGIYQYVLGVLFSSIDVCRECLHCLRSFSYISFPVPCELATNLVQFVSGTLM